MSISKRLRESGHKGEHPFAGFKSTAERDEPDDGPAEAAADGYYRIGKTYYRIGSGPRPDFGRPTPESPREVQGKLF